MITIIKEFHPTRVVLECLTTKKEVVLTTSEGKPFDYDIIKSIWEDIEIN